MLGGLRRERAKNLAAKKNRRILLKFKRRHEPKQATGKIRS